jgi:hypothetical protein
MVKVLINFALLGLSACQVPQVSTAQAVPSPATLPAGRYALFQGDYQFINFRGQEFRQRALLKIDTVTGDVWIGEQMQVPQKDGRVVQTRSWRPFNEETELSKEMLQQMR